MSAMECAVSMEVAALLGDTALLTGKFEFVRTVEDDLVVERHATVERDPTAVSDAAICPNASHPVRALRGTPEKL